MSTPRLRGIVTYHFDVWGNPENGFEVNDSRAAGEIEVSPLADTAEVAAAVLKNCRIVLREGDTFCESDGCDPETFYDPDGRPVVTIDWHETT